MKAIWKGTIGFGLVSIPVRMYSAAQASELDLDMLDAKDHARIHFQRVNEHTGKEVPWERIVRGYGIEGRYVVVDEKDMHAAAHEKSDVITIQDFVQETEVAGKYYEKPYYLEPEKGGTRAYALLREALRKSGKVGVATFVMRAKEHAAILMPDGPVLMLNQIRYAEEIRDVDDLELPSVQKVSASELKLAMQLVDQGTGKFNISKYKDTYTAALLKRIRAKAKGKAPAVKTMKVVHKRTADDLMSVLKASLGKSSKNKKAS